MSRYLFGGLIPIREEFNFIFTSLHVLHPHPQICVNCVVLVRCFDVLRFPKKERASMPGLRESGGANEREN